METGMCVEKLLHLVAERKLICFLHLDPTSQNSNVISTREPVVDTMLKPSLRANRWVAKCVCVGGDFQSWTLRLCTEKLLCVCTEFSFSDWGRGLKTSCSDPEVVPSRRHRANAFYGQQE